MNKKRTYVGKVRTQMIMKKQGNDFRPFFSARSRQKSRDDTADPKKLARGTGSCGISKNE